MRGACNGCLLCVVHAARAGQDRMGQRRSLVPAAWMPHLQQLILGLQTAHGLQLRGEVVDDVLHVCEPLLPTLPAARQDMSCGMQMSQPDQMSAELARTCIAAGPPALQTLPSDLPGKTRAQAASAGQDTPCSAAAAWHCAWACRSSCLGCLGRQGFQSFRHPDPVAPSHSPAGTHGCSAGHMCALSSSTGMISRPLC